MNTNESLNSIDLKMLFDKFMQYKILFAICVAISILGSFIHFKFNVTPVYTSSSVMYVNCMSAEQTAEEGISEYEIQSSRALTTTYMEILCGRTFLNSVSADIGYKYSWKELSSMISISQVNETELLSVNVRAHTPEDAYIVCKSVVDNGASKMLTVFKRGTVEIIDEVNMPTSPSAVSIKYITFIGFVIGMILGFVIAFVLEILDTKIRSAQELNRRYNIIVLGEIYQ